MNPGVTQQSRIRNPRFLELQKVDVSGAVPLPPH